MDYKDYAKPTIIIVLEQEGCEIVEYEHAYRANGIVEIYRNSLKLRNLITTEILVFKKEDDRINHALTIVTSNQKRSAHYTLEREKTPRQKPKPKPQIKINRAYKIPFGKFKGLKIGEVPHNYLKWAMENIPTLPKPFRDFCESEIKAY
jgi:hypothetical protein